MSTIGSRTSLPPLNPICSGDQNRTKTSDSQLHARTSVIASLPGAATARLARPGTTTSLRSTSKIGLPIPLTATPPTVHTRLDRDNATGCSSSIEPDNPNALDYSRNNHRSNYIVGLTNPSTYNPSHCQSNSNLSQYPIAPHPLANPGASQPPSLPLPTVERAKTSHGERMEKGNPPPNQGGASSNKIMFLGHLLSDRDKKVNALMQMNAQLQLQMNDLMRVNELVRLDGDLIRRERDALREMEKSRRQEALLADQRESELRELKKSLRISQSENERLVLLNSELREDKVNLEKSQLVALERCKTVEGEWTKLKQQYKELKQSFETRFEAKDGSEPNVESRESDRNQLVKDLAELRAAFQLMKEDRDAAVRAREAVDASHKDCALNAIELSVLKKERVGVGELRAQLQSVRRELEESKKSMIKIKTESTEAAQTLAVRQTEMVDFKAKYTTMELERDTVLIQLSDVKHEKQELKQQLEQLKEQREQETHASQEEISNLRQSLSEALKKIEVLSLDKKTLKNKLSAVEEERANLATERVAARGEEEARIERMTRMVNEVKLYKETINKLQETITSKSDNIQQLERQVEILVLAKKRADNEVTAQGKRAEEAEIREKQMVDKVNELNDVILRKQRTVETLTVKHEHTVRLNQKQTQVLRILEEKSQNHAEISTQLQEAREKLEMLSTSSDRCAMELKQLSKTHNQLLEEHRRLQRAHNELDARAVALKQRSASAEAKYAAQSDELSKLKMAYMSTARDLLACQRQLLSSNLTGEDLNAQVHAALETAATTKEEVAKSQQRIAQLEKALAYARSELTDANRGASQLLLILSQFLGAMVAAAEAPLNVANRKVGQVISSVSLFSTASSSSSVKPVPLPLLSWPADFHTTLDPSFTLTPIDAWVTVSPTPPTPSSQSIKSATLLTVDPILLEFGTHALTPTHLLSSQPFIASLSRGLCSLLSSSLDTLKQRHRLQSQLEVALNRYEHVSRLYAECPKFDWTSQLKDMANEVRKTNDALASILIQDGAKGEEEEGEVDDDNFQTMTEKEENNDSKQAVDGNTPRKTTEIATREAAGVTSKTLTSKRRRGGASARYVHPGGVDEALVALHALSEALEKEYDKMKVVVQQQQSPLSTTGSSLASSSPTINNGIMGSGPFDEKSLAILPIEREFAHDASPLAPLNVSINRLAVHFYRTLRDAMSITTALKQVNESMVDEAIGESGDRVKALTTEMQGDGSATLASSSSGTDGGDRNSSEGNYEQDLGGWKPVPYVDLSQLLNSHTSPVKWEDALQSLTQTASDSPQWQPFMHELKALVNVFADTKASLNELRAVTSSCTQALRDSLGIHSGGSNLQSPSSSATPSTSLPNTPIPSLFDIPDHLSRFMTNRLMSPGSVLISPLVSELSALIRQMLVYVPKPSVIKSNKQPPPSLLLPRLSSTTQSNPSMSSSTSSSPAFSTIPSNSASAITDDSTNTSTSQPRTSMSDSQETPLVSTTSDVWPGSPTGIASPGSRLPSLSRQSGRSFSRFPSTSRASPHQSAH